MLRKILLLTIVTVLAAGPVSAKADWHKASSDHFVIYAEDSPKDLAKFAELLERYHAAMVTVTSKKLEKPSPSNRVTIFAVGSERDVQELAGWNSKYLQGFYVPRAGGSRAFVQNVRPNGREPDNTLITLLHEYAHHYLISSSRFAMPRWMSEGAAEFFASASFQKDGRVLIGRPANHRAGELNYADDVTVHELLDEELYAARKSNRYDAFYGRSWLLYHYLIFSEERTGQFQDYWVRLAKGSASPDAARAAFGDLDQLQKDLDKYLRSRRMLTYNIPGDELPIGPITVTRLSEGMGEMMPVMIRSQRGVDQKSAQELVVDAREVAAKFPDDAGVLTALAEAEFDAGNPDAAIAAADRAIALDPGSKNAYVQKGYALFEKAADADDPDAAYQVAMKPFSALNAIENDHPLPLIYYYRSFAERGREPPENAKHALERAAELAPFDLGLAFQVAVMEAQEGRIPLARHMLMPIAHDPHGGTFASQAELLLNALEAAPQDQPFHDFGVMNDVVSGDDNTTE
ncbi:DUF1570 domain-containing protein [Altererythrobacter sp.]|uniref:DUF1570 domain-containing protein n=1 Tax=Altererythrobacter sp. TaxID=1872480 RepID=UPI003D11D73D